MSTGPSKLDLDVSSYVKGMQQALNWTLKYAKGMQTVAVTSLEFNREGKKTDATVELITKSGEKILASLKKVKGGYEVTSATIKKSLADITRANEEAAKALKQKSLDQNLTDFRRSTGTGLQKNVFPKGGQQQDYRQLFGGLSGLETYIRRGEITAKRAQTLIQDIQQGASKRVTGSSQQEAFRLDALKLFQDAQALQDKLAKRQQRSTGAANAPKVQSYLDTIFGKIDPAATTTQTRRVEASFIQLQKIVKETGIDFTRFQDLVTKSMAGVADPVTIAERRITQALARIRTDFQGAKDLATKNAAKVASTQEAKNVGDFLKKSLNTSGLDDHSLERVYAQIARIQNLVARGPGQNGLSGAQFAKVWTAVSTGAKTSFLGAEEQARASMAKIQNIIKGSLANPFEVNISLGNSFNVIKSMIAANFALELLEKFKTLVDEAAEFQRAIALIQTITQDDMSFNQWAEGIRRVSDELGKPVIEIASAGYDLLSNQVTHAADTFDVLSTAGQFARITNSNTEDSVNLLSTAINTFRLNASDAQRIADEFFTVIDLGRVKAQGLANSGRTFEFGKTIGASIQDINASLITLTQSGIKEDTAMTLLNNVFQKLLNPTKELQAVYDRLGVSTGENFVKTYGWAGAMQKLKEETGGSSAKLADLFNEIRGYQGVSNLIDRIDILTNSYKEFESSAENAAKAKKNFDDLPGQQYLEQTNKIKNAFTLGFKTILLKDVLDVGNAFGGLDILLKGIIQTTGALATGVAAALAIEKVLEFSAAAKGAGSAMLLLQGALNGGLWTVGIGAAAGALTFFTYKLIEAEGRSRHLFDTIGEELEKTRRKTNAADEANRSREVAGFEKEMNKKKQVLLEYAAVARQALDKQAEALDKSGSTLGETLKNSLELLLSSVKTSLQEVINAQTTALRSIKDLQKEKKSLGAERDSALFEFHKARLGTANNVGGFNEKNLYQARIDQLKKQAVKAAQGGDKDNALNAAKEIENLTSELASKTVEVNGVNYLKYYGQEQAINEALSLRGKLLDILISKRKQESDALETQRKTEAERVAEAEDAAKSLYSFKLTDEKTGKQLYKSPAEVEAELDKREQRFRKATAGFRGHNALESEELIQRRREKAQEDYLKFRQNRSERSTVGSQQDKSTETVDEINKRFGDDANTRLKEIQKAADASGKAFSAAADEVQKYLGAFKGNGPNLPLGQTAGFPTAEDQKKANRPKTNLLTNIEMSLQNKNYEKAIGFVEELIALYTKLGIAQQTGHLGPNAEVMTARESLITLRARISQAKDASTEHQANQDAFKAVGGQSGQAAGVVDALIGKYGELNSATSGAAKALQSDFKQTSAFVDDLTQHVKDAVTEMDNLAKSLKAARDSALNPTSTDPVVPKKWMGGDVGYFSDGGSISDFMSGKYASGVDTIPIMANRGEFIVNAQATNRFKSQLIAMNSGFDPGSSGAHGSTTNVGDIHVHVQGGGNSQQTIREIAAGLQREMRRGTIKLGS